MVFTMLCLIGACSVFVSTWRVQVCQLQHKREIVPVWLFISHLQYVDYVVIHIASHIFYFLLYWVC